MSCSMYIAYLSDIFLLVLFLSIYSADLIYSSFDFKLLAKANQRRIHKKAMSKNTKRIFCTCGRSFIYATDLNYHKRWECGRRIPCTVVTCQSTFATKSVLRQHLKKVHKT